MGWRRYLPRFKLTTSKPVLIGNRVDLAVADDPVLPTAPEGTMNDQKKTRELKPAPYIVEDGEGKVVGRYYATSTTQAKAMHTENLSARRATTDELIEIGRNNIPVTGMEQEGDSRQIDMLNDGSIAD